MPNLNPSSTQPKLNPTLREILERQNIRADLKWWDSFSISPQFLFDNNFKPFQDRIKNSRFAMQKRYDDEVGKKYFITFYFYHMDEREFPNIPQSARSSWSAENQFVVFKTGTVSNISVHNKGPEHTLLEVENYFEELFNKMGFSYYENFAEHSEDEMNQKQLAKSEAANLAVYVNSEKIEIENSLGPAVSSVAAPSTPTNKI